MTAFTDEERNELREAIRSKEPDWYRAYELREEGASSRELAVAFDLKSPNGPRGWANAVDLLLGTSGSQIGEYRHADYNVRLLSDRVLSAEILSEELRTYVLDTRDRAAEAYTSGAYDNPATRAWETIRARQAEEAETEAELDEEVVEDVAATQAYQIYAWTYSGIPTSGDCVVVKIGYAGTGPTSDAWRRMTDACRTTGSPGAPTMLRVWQGSGGPEAAKRSEVELQSSAGRQIIGGGNEWFTTNLEALDSRARCPRPRTILRSEPGLMRNVGSLPRVMSQI